MEYAFYTIGGIFGLGVLCIVCNKPLHLLDNCIKDEESCFNSSCCRSCHRCICCEENSN